MIRSLKFLQLNLHRSAVIHDAVHNDTDLEDCTAILGQEPNCFIQDGEVMIHGGGARWTCFSPPHSDGKYPVGSCCWVRKEATAVQVHVDDENITAALTTQAGGKRQVLVFSVYVPPIRMVAEGDTQLLNTLRKIEETYMQERAHNPNLELLVGGDFNRHHTLWGSLDGSHQGSATEGESIIELMARLGLQSMLKPGEKTYKGAPGLSTVDLALGSHSLVEALLRCIVWGTDYGSDHEAILSEFADDLAPLREAPRLSIKMTNWEKIKKDVERQARQSNMLDFSDVNVIEGQLTAMVMDALRAHCGTPRQSQYVKRWWNWKLSALRARSSYLLKRATALRKAGEQDEQVEKNAREATHEFQHTVRAAKQKHWKDFLDNTDNV